MDLTWSEFERVEMRVGTITTAVVFPEARKPAYKLEIDFGGIGDQTEFGADHQAVCS